MRSKQKNSIAARFKHHWLGQRFSLLHLQLAMVSCATAGMVIGIFYLANELVIPQLFAASSPWTQDDWSGGISANTVTGSVTTYSEATGVTASADQVSLEQFGGDMAVLKSDQVSSGENFNVASWTVVDWNVSQSYSDTCYSFDNSEAEDSKLTIEQNGDYLLGLTIAFASDGVSDSGNRSAIEAEIRVNGSPVDIGEARATYVRNYGGHDESTGNLTVLLEDLEADDEVEVYVQRTTNDTTHSYTADVTMYMEEIEASEQVFFGKGTRTTEDDDLNDAAAAMEWTASRTDTGYSHDDENPEQITLSEAGNYFVAVNIPLGSSVQRSNLIGKVLLDGVLANGGRFQQGYIRSASDHYDASIHWHGVVQATGGEALTVTVEQESEPEEVTVDGEKATIYAQKLPDDDVFFATAITADDSSNWNPTSAADINWSTEVITDDLFIHSTEEDDHQITVSEAGEYILAFNAAYVSDGVRVNPKVTVHVNGSPVEGAEAKSAYIRNDGTSGTAAEHTHSSSTLFFPLTLEEGDTMHLEVEAEAATTATSLEDEATLLLWRKGYGSSGSLVSNIFDAGFYADWGEITYTANGAGAVIKARSDDDGDFTDADPWINCASLSSGAVLADADETCIISTEEYLQYRVELSGTGKSSPALQDISIAFSASDTVRPDLNATNIQMVNLADTAWTNSGPTITWTAGDDDDAGNGLAGYCVSLNEVETGDDSELLDPETDAGVLAGINDGIDNNSTCGYIAAGTSLNLSSVSGLNLSTGKQYYFSIKAVDLAGNVYTGDAEDYQDLISFKYDDTAPDNPDYISLPGDYLSTKSVTFFWPSIGSDGPVDDDSGLAGLQYRIGESGTWYGDSHTGNEDINDLLTNDGSYTTDETYDYDVINEGSNLIYLRTWDNADNVSSTVVQAALKINTTAPSAPLNLAVTPEDATTNSYEFSWDAPTTFTGQSDNIEYCYTVNTTPSAVTCNWTAAGETSLSADAYATQPGINTFYLVAKDEAGNVSYSVYDSVEFTYSGTAPGIPQNIDIADVSVKATSSWKLATSWEVPSDTGAGIANYKVYDSTDGVAYSLKSTVTGISYVDTGLTQATHYYKVKACDSANNCGAFTEAVSLYPDGKFTTAADLTSGPTATGITTKKATISWGTDRTSDSKIQYGDDSSDYFDEEPSKSTHTTDHSIQLTNLSPGTTYYYKAKWTDEDGNTGMSDEETFTTDPAPSSSEVSAATIGLDYATVQFTSSNATSAKIYYGETTAFGGFTEISTSTSETTYNVNLTGLKDGTKYFYKVNLFDSEGEEYEGETHSFETLPRPQVSNVRLQQVKGASTSTVLITWTSNTPITSVVTYYPSANPGQALDDIDVKLTQSHRALISGLLPSTPYTLVVKGRDKAGNEATSNPQTFTTATDTRPPVIANLKVEPVIEGVGEEAVARLVVSWDTDEPATAQVRYGEGSTGELSSSTQLSDNLTFNHVAVVPNLQPAKVYHLKAVSQDEAGNEAQSIDSVIITPKATDSALNLVVNNLSQAFSFLKNVQ